MLVAVYPPLYLGLKTDIYPADWSIQFTGI